MIFQDLTLNMTVFTLSLTVCNHYNYRSSQRYGVQEGAIIFSPHISFCDLHPIVRIAIFFAAPTSYRVVVLKTIIDLQKKGA